MTVFWAGWCAAPAAGPSTLGAWRSCRADPCSSSPSARCPGLAVVVAGVEPQSRSTRKAPSRVSVWLFMVRWRRRCRHISPPADPWPVLIPSRIGTLGGVTLPSCRLPARTRACVLDLPASGEGEGGLMNLSEPPHSASVFRDGAGRGCLRSGGSQVVMAGKSTRGDGGTSRARRLVFPTVAQARQTSGVNVDRRCFLAFGPMFRRKDSRDFLWLGGEAKRKEGIWSRRDRV
jgi:hypothetical protein